MMYKNSLTKIIISLLDSLTELEFSKYGIRKKFSKLILDVNKSDNFSDNESKYYNITFTVPKATDGMMTSFIQKNMYYAGKRLTSEIIVEEKENFIKIKYHFVSGIYYFVSPEAPNQNYYRFTDLLVINKTDQKKFLSILKEFLHRNVEAEVQYIIYTATSYSEGVTTKTHQSILENEEKQKEEEKKNTTFYDLFSKTHNLMIRFNKDFTKVKVKEPYSKVESSWKPIKKDNHGHFVKFDWGKLYLKNTTPFKTNNLDKINKKFGVPITKVMYEVTETPSASGIVSLENTPMYIYNTPFFIKKDNKFANIKTDPFVIPVKMSKEGWPPLNMEKPFPIGLHDKNWREIYKINEFAENFKHANKLSKETNCKFLYATTTPYPMAILERENKDFLILRKKGDKIILEGINTNEYYENKNLNEIIIQHNIKERKNKKFKINENFVSKLQKYYDLEKKQFVQNPYYKNQVDFSKFEKIF